MSEFPGNGDPEVSRFYDNYLKFLDKASIPQNQRRWYVKHIEGFIEAQRGRGIWTLSAAEFNQYLEMLGRQERLTDWQFRQKIHAIRILYCRLLGSSLCREVDWQYRLDASRQLDGGHPTNARQLTPEELSHLKARSGSGPVNRVRSNHRDLLVRFTTKSFPAVSPTAPNRVTSSGSAALSCSARGRPPNRSVRPRSRRTWIIWLLSEMSVPVPRIRRLMPWSFSISRCLDAIPVISRALSVHADRRICRWCSAGTKSPPCCHSSPALAI